MPVTAVLFLAGFSIGLLLALIRHPIYGLSTYVLVFYVHPPSRWWGEALPDLRWALIAAAVTLLACFRLQSKDPRPGWYSQTPLKILLFYTAWVWLQLLWALDREEHLYFATLLTKFIFVFYMVYKILDTPSRVATFLLTHVVGCLFLGWLAHTTDYSGRLDGVGGPGIDDSNTLAMQMATGIMAASMLVLQQKGWKRWLSVLAMPFMLDTMIMSGSRSGFLALIAGGVVLWFFRPDYNRRLFHILAVAGVLSFLAVASVQFWERMGTLKAATADAELVEESALSRRVLAKAQLRMAMKYPFGAGHRGTAVLSPDYLDKRWLTAGDNPIRSSHNTFLTALVEQGVPGVFIFVMLWSWAWRNARHTRRAPATAKSPETQAQLAAVAAALAAIFVAGMFVDYVRAEIQFWMFPLLAVLLQNSLRDSARAEATLGLHDGRNGTELLPGSAASGDRPGGGTRPLAKRGQFVPKPR